DAVRAPLGYVDRRMLLDDPGDPRLPVTSGIDGEQRHAAAHRSDVAVGILVQDPEIAVGTLVVAPVAGDDADAIRTDAGLDEFAESAVRRGVIIELRHDDVPGH